MLSFAGADGVYGAASEMPILRDPDPNLIPLPAAAVRRVAAAVAPYAFEQLYGAWWGLNVLADAAGAVRRSVARYEAALAGAHAGETAETSVPAPVPASA